MKRVYATTALGFFFVLGFSLTARAAAGFEITPGIGYLTGYTQYEIGNVPAEDDFVTPPRDPYWPISRLRFPLMSSVAAIDAKATLGIVSVSGGFARNFTHDTGHMRDYDWGMPYYDPGGPNGPGWYVHEWTDGTDVWYDLDVESKSRTRLDARMWKAKVACRVYTYRYDYYDTDWYTKEVRHNKGELTVDLGLGYEKRNFNFVTKLIKQWSPSGHDEEYACTGDGREGLTYDIDYSIPFAELSVAHHGRKVHVQMDFGATNLVHVSDKDVHLLRNPGPKISTGNLTGNALKFNGRAQYDITPGWFLGAAADYLFIRANGTQHQHVDAGDSWEEMNYRIKERVTSHQSIFSFNIGYRFNSMALK
jgi:hypothetical protein